MVEREAELEQQSPLEDPGRQVRVTRLAADGPEQDRVVPAHLVQHAVGEHFTSGEVPLGPEVVAGLLEGRVGDGAEDLEGLVGHLGTDAVAADDRDPVGSAHGGRD